MKNYCLLALLLLTCFLPACGVLTVDVDVYKGSLMNHQETQVKELASMAIAIKPLLVRLRNQLEDDARLLAASDFATDEPRQYKLQLQYLLRTTGYVPPAAPRETNLFFDGDQGTFAFYSRLAFEVNELLQSYETLKPNDPKAKTDNNSSEPFARVLQYKGYYTYTPSQGRPYELGIVDLLNQYRESVAAHAQTNSPVTAQQLERSKAALFSALTHFAKRMQVIANNDVLLRQRTGALRAAAIVVANTFRGGSTNPFELSETTESVRFVRVLQSFGNSILYQIDEISQHDSHQQRMKDRAQTELAAAATHVPRLNQMTLADLIATLSRLEADTISESEKAKSARKDLQDKIAVLNKKKDELQSILEKLKGVDARKEEVQAAEQDLRSVEKDVAIKEGNKKKHDEYAGEQDHLAAEYRLARTYLDDRRERIMEGVTKGPSGARAYDIALSVLHEEYRKLDPQAEAKKELEKVIARLETLPALVGLLDGMPVPLNSIEAMDQVIAVLRHQQLHLLREKDKAHPEVVQVEAALKEAYQQRANMIYLRPAGAYLRNSYSVSTLQDDAKLGWRNMLGEHGVRQIPFASELFYRSEKLKTLLEIDKQYWQNVNRIRVAGGGFTNYVLAKDDIGNWYVKNYSSDPEDIIKSGKNLALFGLAANGGLSGLRGSVASAAVASKGTTAGGTAASPAGGAKPQEQDGVFGKFQANHNKSTATYLDSTIGKAEGLHTAIRETLGKRLEKSEYRSDIQDAAGAGEADLAKAVKLAKDSAQKDQPANLAVDLMRAMKAYNREAQAKLAIEATTADASLAKKISENQQKLAKLEIERKAMAADDAGIADKEKAILATQTEIKELEDMRAGTAREFAGAKQYVSDTIRDILLDLIEDRQSELNQYESAMNVLQE